MKKAAVGFRAHSGWTALVAVCLEKNEPLVLSRQHVYLLKTFNYSFRQPYHTAEKMPLSGGRKFISQVSAEARRLASRAIKEVQAKLCEANYRVTHCGYGGRRVVSRGPELRERKVRVEGVPRERKGFTWVWRGIAAVK